MNNFCKINFQVLNKNSKYNKLNNKLENFNLSLLKIF